MRFKIESIQHQHCSELSWFFFLFYIFLFPMYLSREIRLFLPSIFSVVMSVIKTYLITKIASVGVAFSLFYYSSILHLYNVGRYIHILHTFMLEFPRTVKWVLFPIIYCSNNKYILSWFLITKSSSFLCFYINIFSLSIRMYLYTPATFQQRQVSKTFFTKTMGNIFIKD